jgi:hypothetical protein
MRPKTGIFALLAVCALPSAVLAQGGVMGRITGSVYDESGSPIKGVKVTATSDTQIGGPKSAYTDDEGNFRILGLLPGRFDVTATALKLKSVGQKNLKVGVSVAVEVNLLMGVETAGETVEIVQKAPVVSTTTANVREVFDEEFVENLPVERKTSVEDIVGHNAAGAVRTGDDRTIRMRGGGNNQNAFNLEGFHMNGQKVTTKSLAALEVQTAGYGAENAAVPGGVVNMVTKSGSNKFEVDVSGFAEDSNLQFFHDQSDVKAHSWNYYINPSFSGAIVKDRVWFYLNTEARSQVNNRERDLTGILGDPAARSYLNNRISLKLTWQVTPRDKLQSYSNLNLTYYKNEGDTNRDERDALGMRENQDQFHGLIYEKLLADNVFFRSQVGYGHISEDRKPERCRLEPEICDHIPQIRDQFPRDIRKQNFDQRRRRIDQTGEFINAIEWFLHSKVFGEHNLKARSRLYWERYEEARSTPGDVLITLRNGQPDRQRISYANDPRLEPARFGWRIRGTTALTTVHSLTDSMKLTRYLTFTPGLALTTASAGNVGESDNIVANTVTPHVAVAWDATHDGRTALRGSFNQYVDTDVLRLSRLTQGGTTPAYLDCRWDEATQSHSRNCTFGGGGGVPGSNAQTIGRPCGPSGVDIQGKDCKEKLRIPKTYEYTAGIEREIMEGIGLGTDLVYRLYTYPYSNIENNRIWGNAGYDLAPNGSFRNGTAEATKTLVTPPYARRRYLGVTTSLNRREGALKALLSYTWSQLEGNHFNDEDTELGSNPARDAYYLYGYLDDDSRHVIKGSMTYQLTAWFSTGVIYRYLSGNPFDRRYRNDVTGFDDLRAPVGINPGNNINDPADDRENRLPDQQEINVKFGFNLKPVTGANVEAYVDVINILALRTPTQVIQQDGPNFGITSSRKDPFHLRFGFRWRY